MERRSKEGIMYAELECFGVKRVERGKGDEGEGRITLHVFVFSALNSITNCDKNLK
jgi:hypothetical protein